MVLRPVRDDLSPRDKFNAQIAAAEAKGDAAGYARGFEEGKATITALVDAMRTERSLAQAEEIARLDERHKANDKHIRNGAFFQGGIVFGALGLLLGGLVVFVGNERALRTGADVAISASERQDILDATIAGSTQPETNE